MLKYGQHYIDKGAEYYGAKKPPTTNRVPKKAAQLGLQVTPAHA